MFGSVSVAYIHKTWVEDLGAGMPPSQGSRYRSDDFLRPVLWT